MLRRLMLRADGDLIEIWIDAVHLFPGSRLISSGPDDDQQDHLSLLGRAELLLVPLQRQRGLELDGRVLL